MSIYALDMLKHGFDLYFIGTRLLLERLIKKTRFSIEYRTFSKSKMFSETKQILK